MNLSQLIKAFAAKSADIEARMKEILKTAAEDDDGPRTLTDVEQDEYDALEKELASVKSHIERLEKQREKDAQTAQAPNDDPDRYKGQRIVVKANNSLPEEHFKGQRFAQLVKSRCVAAIDGVTLREAAEYIYGKSVADYLVKVDYVTKAANPVDREDSAGVIGSPVQDFIDLLRAESVYDRLSFRRVRSDIPIARQLTGTTGYWVAEGAAITQSKLTTDRFTLTPMKVGAIVPLTFESVRDSDPSTDQLVAQDLVYALQTRVDTTLVSNAGASTGTPAGLLNGVTPVVTSGTDPEDLVADIKGLRNQFPRELQGRIELLMGPDMAADIAAIRTELNVQVFPGMSVNGGTLEGFPVTTSTGVPKGTMIALIPQEVYAIADSGVEIAVSRDATIDGTSLFEQALIGVRAIRSVNWALRRPGVVQFIQGAEYGPAASPTAS